MATDHNQGRRGGHFHRGRRGPDRRGPDRRQGPPPEQPNRAERVDRVDVEQIMREIRSRISQRSGIDLTNQQIQELAARRLEAILDPRGLKPELLEQLRRSAGERATAEPPAPSVAQSFPFDEATLYDSPNALLRFLRKLFRPLLRMMINPTPMAHALAQQSRLNGEIAAREAERDRRQAEWNALHYEILQRLATEVSRASIEAQSLSLRVESLAAKVDFNERRVRSMEGAQVHARPQRAPDSDRPAAQPASPVAASPAMEGTPQTPPAEGTPSGEAPRRRRRRRRGRRGPGMGAPADVSMPAGAPAAIEEGSPASEANGADDGDVDGDEGFEEEVSAERVEHHEEAAAAPASAPTPVPEAAPEPRPEPVQTEDASPSPHVPEE